MIDTKQLLEYAKHPELALQNLSELLEQVESTDESIQNIANEALENCGPPSINELPMILRGLASHRPTTIYWSSTLLGRMGSSASELVDWNTIESQLVAHACNVSLDISARERSVWALGEIGKLSSANRQRLEAIPLQSLPRLQRLIHKTIDATP